jgi:hypothetical protein
MDRETGAGTSVRRGRRMRNLALAAGVAAALVAVTAGTAGAAPTGVGIASRPGGPAAPATPPGPPPGALGPIVTHLVQESFGYPAGEVCSFPSHSDFPVQDLTLKTWTDTAGNPVFATETGPLYMRTTNLDTGWSVLSDISGSGVITYPDYPDTSTYVLSGNDWAAGFHTTDSPVHNHWIVAHGYMSVKISTVDGVSSRTLLALHGPYTDLCKVLQPSA